MYDIVKYVSTYCNKNHFIESLKKITGSHHNCIALSKIYTLE